MVTPEIPPALPMLPVAPLVANPVSVPPRFSVLLPARTLPPRTSSVVMVNAPADTPATVMATVTAPLAGLVVRLWLFGASWSMN